MTESVYIDTSVVSHLTASAAQDMVIPIRLTYDKKEIAIAQGKSIAMPEEQPLAVLRAYP